MKVFPLLAAGLLLASCTSQPEPRISPRASEEPSTPATNEPTGGSRARLHPGDIDIEFETIFKGLSLPVLLTHAGDGSGRVFVVEQTGRILVGRVGGSLSEFLNISSLVVARGEQGLLGLAFHPEYAANGRFFVNYTDRNGDTVIAEYRRASTDTADPNSARVLRQIDQPYANHNGGHLAFGPDGYLYIATGDGGSGGDPEERAQDRDSLLGKLLRIDVDARSGGNAYGIPSDNPFADGGGRDEIWAYGLRNPWRFSFDGPTETLWIGDVGQGVLEEIDRAPIDEPGVNYGWDVLEGTRCFEPSSGCDRSGMTPPVAEYDHELGCSVTGGHVYRGEEFPDMNGGYFFGDFCSGRIWVLDAARPRRITELAATELSVSSFGTDERGELYVTDLGGRVVRVLDRSR